MVRTFQVVSLIAALAALAGLAIATARGNGDVARTSVMLMAVGLAIGVGAAPPLAGYRYTAWIVAAVAAGLCFPEVLLRLNPDDSSRPLNKWLMLLAVQMVMFGMGTQMALRDFASVGRSGPAVLVGLVLQFTVMPLAGFALATSLKLPDEVAAGVILIGSCSSGLASNVLTFLAGGNLPLSITLTAAGTLLAPLLTPLWMKALAGAKVEVQLVGMMIQIVKIMLVPLGAALVHDYLRVASPRGWRAMAGASVLSAGLLVGLHLGGWAALAERLGPTSLSLVGLVGFVAAGVLVGIAYHGLVTRAAQVARVMPAASMFGIIYYTAVTTAAGRKELLAIGGVLVAAAVTHNLVGYVLGYWLSRAVGLNRIDARTVSLEVGLQNGGMATGIASAMGKLGTLGLAAAIFSPWMNVSGSILANWWRRRPAGDANYDAARSLQRTSE